MAQRTAIDRAGRAVGNDASGPAYWAAGPGKTVAGGVENVPGVPQAPVAHPLGAYPPDTYPPDTKPPGAHGSQETEGMQGSQGLHGLQTPTSAEVREKQPPRRSQSQHWQPTKLAVSITTAVKISSFFIA